MNSTDTPTSDQDRIGPFRILLFSVIFFGLAVTEEVSVNILPLTLKRMTEGLSLELALPFALPGLAPEGVVFIGSAFVIGLILALNPFFGFIAQPLVGLISDRVWTPVGRRAFFLILGAPVVALCLIAVPFAGALWQLVIVVVVYQFFQDVLWGSDHPLLADLFPSRQRGIVVACLTAAYQMGSVFVNRVGIAWVDSHEKAHGGELFGLPVYVAAAVCQVGCVMFLAFFLWERKYENRRRRAKLTVRTYVKDFIDQPGLFRMGMINFLRAYMTTAATGFLVLFGTVTLAAEKVDYARYIGLLPFLSLVYIWIVGAVADRMRRDWFLIFGFAFCFVGYAIGSQSNSLFQLAVAFVVFRFAWAVVEVGYKSLITEFYPRELIGQLAGAINIFFATGRTLALVTVGAIIGMFGDNYRVAWYIAMVAAIANIVMMLGIRDPVRGGANPRSTSSQP